MRHKFFACHNSQKLKIDTDDMREISCYGYENILFQFTSRSLDKSNMKLPFLIAQMIRTDLVFSKIMISKHTFNLIERKEDNRPNGPDFTMFSRGVPEISRGRDRTFMCLQYVVTVMLCAVCAGAACCVCAVLHLMTGQDSSSCCTCTCLLLLHIICCTTQTTQRAS